MHEASLERRQLILPLFINANLSDEKIAIKSLPGHFQHSLHSLADEIREVVDLGIVSVILFGIPRHKDAIATESFAADGIIQQAIPVIKSIAPDLMVITDLCCCEYTSHGHCGLIDEQGYLKNDETLTLLQRQAISHAAAGADMVAPSGMVDGMVQAIRSALDQHHFINTPILSYAVKYASALYAPFREAALGAPTFGDRRSHQLDIRNSREAMREVALDIQEGADLIMVKPALPYLDMLVRIRASYPDLPLVAYSVSGEYAMLKAASERGWLDDQAVMLETLIGIRRAGADLIITYAAKEAARLLK